MRNRLQIVSMAVLAAPFTLAAEAPGQSFNIDIAPVAAAPPPAAYAGAGRAGTWFVTPATEGATVTGLVDVHGDATSVSFLQVGGTETLVLADDAVTGDDATLLNDCLITHTTVENCLFFSGLQPGTYEVIVYARMPNEPDVIALADVDQEPGNPKKPVGGVWTGQHVDGVSYSIHVATVGADGKLGVHSGVPAGGDFSIGAALNGLQIHRIDDCPADCANDDNSVDVFDLFALLTSWGAAGPGSDIAEPTNVADVFDLFGLLSAWGGCE